jgi:hypothetical protein
MTKVDKEPFVSESFGAMKKCALSWLWDVDNWPTFRPYFCGLAVEYSLK